MLETRRSGKIKLPETALQGLIRWGSSSTWPANFRYFVELAKVQIRGRMWAKLPHFHERTGQNHQCDAAGQCDYSL